MATLPPDYSLVRDLAALRRDLAFVRAWRSAKFITTVGDIPIVYSPQARNATIDLRALTASGVVGSGLPAPSGVAAYLVTDGAVASWQPYATETNTWRTAILAAGGTVSTHSRVIADRLIRAIQTSGFSSKIVYLLPLLGGDLTAGLMPLRDALGAGAATNTNFVNADFSEATGLQGNGTNKILDTNLKPSQLGTSDNGGLGYLENNISFAGSGVEPMGCYSADGVSARYVLDLRTNVKQFCWGAPAFASLVTPATDGHYYGQCDSTTSRKLYLDGTSIATDTTASARTGANQRNIRLMGSDEGAGGIFYWAGRCAGAYMTQGTLTDPEAAAFQMLLQNFLSAPTGR